MAALATLDAVKKFLVVQNSNQDTLIEQLLARESRLIEQYTSRRFPCASFVGRRLNGTGGSMLCLPEAPILSIESLEIAGVAVASSAFTFDDTTIYLSGGATFPYGRQNVTCSWTTGYQESETDVIPDDTPATLEPSTGGAPAAVVSVANATTGAAFTEVDGNPSAGQFSFSDGVFTFAAADANTVVTMVYRYVPGPVAQACIEMVGIDLQQRNNMGINSKSLAGETVTYTDRGMTPSVKEMLQPYRRMYPA